MSDAATPDTGRDPETGQFLKGHRGGPGRQRGSRNKLGEAFLTDLYAHWQEHGQEALTRCFASKPEVYVRVVASILPQQLEIKDGTFDGVTDDQLVALVAAARNVLGVPAEDAEGTHATAH